MDLDTLYYPVAVENEETIPADTQARYSIGVVLEAFVGYAEINRNVSRWWVRVSVSPEEYVGEEGTGRYRCERGIITGRLTTAAAYYFDAALAQSMVSYFRRGHPPPSRLARCLPCLVKVRRWCSHRCKTSASQGNPRPRLARSLP